MKNHIGRNVKKIAAGLLAGALVLSGICYLPVNNQKVYAAGAVNENDIHTEQFEISNYIKESGRTAPKPQETGYEEWVFAGWYSKESCSKETALKRADAAQASGMWYAKFVPAELLSVKCQTLLSTTESSQDSQLRLVSAVDNLQYEQVGFEIQMEGKEPIDYATDTVYSKITAAEDGDVKVEFDYVPQDFHAMAKYFTTVTLINIQTEDFDAGVLIKPYWETLDGTRVYGVSRYARVEDHYLKIINVPVRLYRDQKVAAGYLEVSCENANVSYYKKWDTGTVFEEMEVAENGNSVHCVGNVEDIGQNVEADGMFVNLRFVWTGEGYPENDLTFTVSGAEFCDDQEEMKTLGVANVIHRHIVSGKSTQ